MKDWLFNKPEYFLMFHKLTYKKKGTRQEWAAYFGCNLETLDNFISEVHCEGLGEFEEDKFGLTFKRPSKQPKRLLINIRPEHGNSTHIRTAKAFQSLFISNVSKHGGNVAKLEAAKEDWVDEVRLMFEVDKIPEDQFRKVFNYLKSPKSKFWHSNILSIKKLRQHFNRLLIQANENHKTDDYSSLLYKYSNGDTTQGNR